jgi:L-alanine-DL-glutamate epimerase-like enolase superfamily enzyme
MNRTVDANTPVYNLLGGKTRDALRACRRLAPYGFDLIESPTQNEDYDGLAALRGRVEADVSEHVSSTAQAMRLIEKGAVDVFNVSVVSWGLQPAQKLFEDLRARGQSAHNVSVVKEAMAQQGLGSRRVRPPLSELEAADRETVQQMLARWGDDG